VAGLVQGAEQAGRNTSLASKRVVSGCRGHAFGEGCSTLVQRPRSNGKTTAFIHLDAQSTLPGRG